VNRKEEDTIITAAALAHGLDPAFLMAIRRQENGGPGREMGVLTVPAPTFEEQVAVACKTVRNRLAEYNVNPLSMIVTDAPDGTRRIVYSPGFIAWFAERWAPVGAANDPGGLNRHWARGVSIFYDRLARNRKETVV